MPLLSRHPAKAEVGASLKTGRTVRGSERPAASAAFRFAIDRPAGIFRTCANPYCRTGRLQLWRRRESPVFEGGWCCSAACTTARVEAALAREMDGWGNRAERHRHRIPLGLAMLEQGWITPGESAQGSRCAEECRDRQAGVVAGAAKKRKRGAGDAGPGSAVGLPGAGDGVFEAGGAGAADAAVFCGCLRCASVADCGRKDSLPGFRRLSRSGAGPCRGTDDRVARGMRAGGGVALSCRRTRECSRPSFPRRNCWRRQMGARWPRLSRLP